jgi:hypothetical protein
MTAAVGCLEAQNSPMARAATAPPVPAQPLPAAMIQVDVAEFDFGKAPLGEKVAHTFLVTNTGELPLQISSVRPGCHCTTVGDWTHEIAPGQTGTISVQFDTAYASAGGQVIKPIQVESNAKNEPHKTLALKGTVWKLIEMSPTILSVDIPPDCDSEVSAHVPARIVNNSDKPLVLSNIVSANRLFHATLKEIKPGKEYQLFVTCAPPFPTNSTQGTITINTSLSNTPTLNVMVMANITAAVQVSPERIFVNSLPDRWMTNAVTIRGNGTNNLLVLSNVRANDSRIDVSVQPTSTKGWYNLLAVFPPGFHLAAGQNAEVTVETSNPRYPEIKIPISEFSRPKPVSRMGGRPMSSQAAGHP